MIKDKWLRLFAVMIILSPLVGWALVQAGVDSMVSVLTAYAWFFVALFGVMMRCYELSEQ